VRWDGGSNAADRSKESRVNLVSSPLVVWVAAACALASQLWFIARLARRYARIPVRVPLRLRLDGRPRAAGSKAGLWIAPIALFVVTLGLAIVLVRRPPPNWDDVLIALAFLICAEVGWFVAWTTDRQVEVARGMTVRIAPKRIVALASPLAVTVLVAIVEAIAQSL
jgi:hypothetical protein